MPKEPKKSLLKKPINEPTPPTKSAFGIADEIPTKSKINTQSKKIESLKIKILEKKISVIIA